MKARGIHTYTHLQPAQQAVKKAFTPPPVNVNIINPISSKIVLSCRPERPYSELHQPAVRTLGVYTFPKNSTTYFKPIKTMNKKEKQTYVPPCIELIHVENEGVIAASGDSVNNFGNGGNWGGAPARNAYGTPATTSDIEDMLEDLFTIE